MSTITKFGTLDVSVGGDLTDGTADIFVNSISSNNLTASSAIKSSAAKKLVSSSLGIEDITSLQSALNVKSELNFTRLEGGASAPNAGELKIYAKGDGELYQKDDTGTEKLIGVGAITGDIVDTGSAQTLLQKTLTAPAIDVVENSLGNNITVPASVVADEFCLLDMKQTLISKTLTTPKIDTIKNAVSVNIGVPGTLGPDTFTLNDYAQTLTNKKLLAPVIVNNTVETTLTRPSTGLTHTITLPAALPTTENSVVQMSTSGDLTLRDPYIKVINTSNYISNESLTPSSFTGSQNTAVGYQAGLNLDTSRSGSTFVGYQAGLGVKASNNTYIGSQAGSAAAGTAAIQNVGIGVFALNSCITTSNVAIGVFAQLRLSTNCANNMSIGSFSLEGNNVGGPVENNAQNSVIGNNGCRNVQTFCSKNVGVGFNVGLEVRDNCTCNILMGVSADVKNSNGNVFGIALGCDAICDSREFVFGSPNVDETTTIFRPNSNGECSLGLTGSRFSNAFITGDVALASINSIAFPTSDGTSGQVLQTNGSGTLSFAGQNLIISSGNTFSSNSKPDLSGPTNCVLHGAGAGAAMTSGDGVVCIGTSSGNTIASRNRCTYIGTFTGALKTGDDNTALGYGALQGGGTTSAFNTALGTYAAISITNGGHNTICGASPVTNTTLTNQDYTSSLGYNCQIGINCDYSIALGANAVTTNANQLMIGSPTGFENITEIVPGVSNDCTLGSASSQFSDLFVNQVLSSGYVESYTTVIGGAATWTKATTTAGGYTSVLIYGMTASDATNELILTYTTGQRARWFDISITATISVVSGANQDLSLSLSKNGSLVPVAGSIVNRRMASSSDIGSIVLQCFVQLSAADTLQLLVRNDSSASDITLNTLNLKVKGLPNVV